MKFKLIFYKTFALIYLLICANVSAADDEISFGIAMGKGVMENVSGLHGVVTGNKGTNIKSLSLDDDSLNTNISINIVLLTQLSHSMVDIILLFRIYISMV